MVLSHTCLGKLTQASSLAYLFLFLAATMNKAFSLYMNLFLFFEYENGISVFSLLSKPFCLM